MAQFHNRRILLSQSFVILLWVAANIFFPSISAAQAPANDECSGATVVGSIPYNSSQNTRLGTANAADPLLPCNSGSLGGSTPAGKTVWFRYTAASTQDLSFSTIGSTPADYDIVLGVYTGTCGALVSVACNDDAVGTRQSKIFYRVQSGTTYYVLVGEWNGGGPNGGVPTGGDLVFTVQVEAPPPVSLGPKSGSLASGVTVSTDQFPTSPLTIDHEQRVIPYQPDERVLVAPKNVLPAKGPEGSNYIEDRPSSPLAASSPVVVKNFRGVPDIGAVIPPDPIMAVGPSHLMGLVNQRFMIFDKNGNVLKTITAANWFNTIAPGSGPNDPQVIYDHFANRWVMLWMTSPTATEHYHMFCVSDDNNPLGTWYQWKTPATTLGDSATTNWGDYPQLGYDSLALYLTSRQFGPLPGGSRRYMKVRIVPKAQLYANTAGPITWKDFWDLRDPDEPTVAPDGVVPSIVYGSPGTFFLINDSPSSGTYFTLWKITNPLTSPTMTAINIPVVAYSTPTLANQLGGSSILIESGGSRIRSRAIYRDSTLWAVHSVASGTGNAYSAAHYVRLNPFTNTNLEDVALGLNGYWHFYPTIMVDQKKNVVISYSRSGLTEYIGAYATGRKNSDPAGLAPSVLMKAGEANYVKDFSSGRNRWGDYNGIGLDPADSSIWAFTEYASSPSSTWGTWFGQMKFDVPGAYVSVEPSSYAFKTTEVGLRGDTTRVTIYNSGADTLVVTNLTIGTPHFILLNAPTLPLKVAPSSSALLSVNFVPQAAGNFTDSLSIVSNAVNFPTVKVRLTANGWVVRQAVARTMYLTSGNLLTANPNTGATTNLGATGFTSVLSARVNPATKEILGLSASGSNTLMLRINSLAGDAHSIGAIPLNNLKGMAFRGDTLYVGRITGAIYRVNISTGAATLVATTSPVINISGLAFHPVTGQLYASVRAPSATPDQIYKVSLPSGATTMVGSTGQGPTQDIIFSNAGQLFGVTNTGTTTNNLIRIDTATGVGTLVGSLGITGAQGLATRPDSSFVTGINDKELGTVPVAYSLDQNYPNPFNPTTQISYGVPEQSRITLAIYNALGQEVRRLVNGIQVAGNHAVTWNGTNNTGEKVASGVYLYKLEAVGSKGATFVQTKKLVLLK